MRFCNCFFVLPPWRGLCFLSVVTSSCLFFLFCRFFFMGEGVFIVVICAAVCFVAVCSVVFREKLWVALYAWWWERLSLCKVLVNVGFSMRVLFGCRSVVVALCRCVVVVEFHTSDVCCVVVKAASSMSRKFGRKSKKVVGVVVTYLVSGNKVGLLFECDWILVLSFGVDGDVLFIGFGNGIVLVCVIDNGVVRNLVDLCVL